MIRVLLEDSGMSRRFVPQPLRLARALALALAAAALAIGAPAAAHHSFAVHFVADKLIDVSGTVTEFSFRNPHGLLALTAKDANGKDQQWKIETNSPNILRRRGWSETSIKPGDLVTVEGYPARDGSNFMRVYRVTFPDGRELVGQRPDPTVPSGKD
ncbi:MAG TPA: DUF6152 family protein [Gammaproteobacteria bacterium]|nr:DUF6152 family protein [Gammaproteobacteria bacterium]